MSHSGECYDILTENINTQNTPLQHSSTVDHGDTEMVSLEVQQAPSA